VERNRGEAIPETARGFQGWYQFLRNAGLITEKEEGVIQKLYGYASEEGAHALGSGPEQVRVAKNSILEWSLMIAGRLENLVRKEAPK
jgi:hypothetical protein